MASEPRFSIVIPSYNYGDYLPYTLESIFNQQRQDTQVIVVDDASTDDTHDVVTRFANQVEYIRNRTNLGAGGAWRVGLREARGEFIIKLDADDALLPASLSALERAFDADDSVGLVAASVLVKNEEKETIEPEYLTQSDSRLSADVFRSRLLRSFFFRMPGTALRRRILEGHEPPDPELYQIHDWEYFLRVTRGHAAFLIREPNAIYRIHDQSITATAQFENRLYKDIQRWIEIAQTPGDRQIDPDELRKLRGSCAELMLTRFGSKRDPRSYARYLSKYFKAIGIASGGGTWQIVRFHLSLLSRFCRKLRLLLTKRSSAAQPI